MKRTHYIYILEAVLTMLITACSHEGTMSMTDDGDELIHITMSMVPFEGDAVTRTSLDGTRISGDKIRMKIICPNSKSWENGETWGGYHEFTCNNDAAVSEVFASSSAREGQSTTYIYTAQNTTDTRIFVSNNIRYTEPSNFFYADQSKQVQFIKSDVIWAQGVRTTGAREVHLNFKHKVAKLNITINDSDVEAFSNNAILTLEGMPDIDGAEIVVGDYYADETFNGDYGNYYYKHKASCSYEYNGKVIGIEVVDDTRKRLTVWGMTGNPAPAGGDNNKEIFGTVPNTGIYTAYHYGEKNYVLYVPPCTLSQNAVFWLRDGVRRYSVPLSILQFEEGVCYNLTLNFGTLPTPPSPDPEP